MSKVKAGSSKRVKAGSSKPSVPAQFAMDEILWAAWLYYEQGLKQDQIAEELHISRASVFNLLQKARDEGLVTIAVDPSRSKHMQLALELCDKMQIRECYVLPATRTTRPLSEQIGQLGARVLETRLEENDTIGVAWGRTVLVLSQTLTSAHFPSITVAQTTGSSAATFDFSPVFCTSNIAAKLSARAVNLHAPGKVSSAYVKDILMEEPAIRDHFTLLRQCTKTLFGVTQLTGPTLLLQGEFMSQEELQAYIDLGAIGFASGYFFTDKGEIVTSEFDDRHITMPINDLRNVPERICLGGGTDKVDAILGMLRAKLANLLITDEATARALLDRTIELPV